MYDLVIKGGRVIDPSQELDDVIDVGLFGGKVAALEHEIPLSECRRAIDGRGSIITPGLIDLHAHVYKEIAFIGVSADIVGVKSGVTTLADAGSSGCATFNGFRKYIVSRVDTRVYSFLHICHTGMTVFPEIRHWDDIDVENAILTIEKNRDLIKGVKIRLVGQLIREEGVAVFKKAKEISGGAQVPLMVHIGDHDAPDTWDLSRQILPLMDSGDVLSHVYGSMPGRVIDSKGTPLPELVDAKQRGVIFEVARGRNHINFDVAKMGLERGITPDVISTDVTNGTHMGPVFSLPAVMSQFMLFGLKLEQVVRMTTVNPARVLGLENELGSLKIGRNADISILKMPEGSWDFTDCVGNVINTRKILLPVLTIKGGREIVAEPTFGK